MVSSHASSQYFSQTVQTKTLSSSRTTACLQVAVPEEGEAEGAGARMRHFQVKIKWASSVNITDIDQYMKCAARPHSLYSSLRIPL